MKWVYSLLRAVSSSDTFENQINSRSWPESNKRNIIKARYLHNMKDTFARALVYNIPYRRAPHSAFRPSASSELRYLVYNARAQSA